jgi:hypothetical protein
MGKMHDFC